MLLPLDSTSRRIISLVVNRRACLLLHAFPFSTILRNSGFERCRYIQNRVECRFGHFAHRSIHLLTHVHQTCLIPVPLRISRVPMDVLTTLRVHGAVIVGLLRTFEAVYAATEVRAVMLGRHLSMFDKE